MAITENVSLILTGSETFVSGAGKMFKKGEIYTMAKEEAVKLLAVKGDFDLRFFKKHEGEKGVEAAPVEVEKKAVLPTQEEIAADMQKDSQERTQAAIAADAADAAATASRGTETGEIDTAIAPAAPKTRGSKAIPV